MSFSHLQQPVSSLQAAILDGGPPGKDVLHVDGRRTADGDISGRYAEAQPLGTCGTTKDGRLGTAVRKSIAVGSNTKRFPFIY